MGDEIKQAIEALKKCDQTFGIMSRSASHSGLEGTKEWDTIAGSADMYGAQDAAREAATALDCLSGRVTVKALSWEETQIARGDGTHEHDGGYEAVTPIGIYGIEIYFGSDSYGWEVRLDSVGKVADCDDPDTAKAAAQADFEARILAAIDTAPAPSPDQIRREALNQAASDVLAERQRQVEQEGWAPEHDDQHNLGTLSGAGSAYALNASYLLNPYHGTPLDDPPDSWLWDREWWKPNMGDSPRRDLVKAGALILAEIERLDRESGAPPAAAPTPSPDQIRR